MQAEPATLSGMRGPVVLNNPQTLRGDGGPNLAPSARAVIDLKSVPVACLPGKSNVGRFAVCCCFGLLVRHGESPRAPLSGLALLVDCLEIPGRGV